MWDRNLSNRRWPKETRRSITFFLSGVQCNPALISHTFQSCIADEFIDWIRCGINGDFVDGSMSGVETRRRPARDVRVRYVSGIWQKCQVGSENEIGIEGIWIIYMLSSPPVIANLKCAEQNTPGAKKIVAQPHLFAISFRTRWL